MARLAAVFFLPHEAHAAASLDMLLQRAGALALAPTDDGTGMIHCQWAGWGGCRAALMSLPYHHVLFMYFWQSVVLDQLVKEEDAPPAKSLIKLEQAFATACTHMVPDAAFIVQSLWQANSDFVKGLEWVVLSKSADVLVAERFPVTYLKHDTAQFLVRPLTGQQVDDLGHGQLIFAGEGAKRWSW